MTGITVKHRFAASAERVYDAWLDPATVRRFLFTTATGEIVRCDVDARVGGAYTIVDRRNGEDILHEGTYLELDRPQRIVFTLRVPKYPRAAQLQARDARDRDEVARERGDDRRYAARAATRVRSASIACPRRGASASPASAELPRLPCERDIRARRP